MPWGENKNIACMKTVLSGVLTLNVQINFITQSVDNYAEEIIRVSHFRLLLNVSNV